MSFIGWCGLSDSVEPAYTHSLSRPNTGPPATSRRTTGSRRRASRRPTRAAGGRPARARGARDSRSGCRPARRRRRSDALLVGRGRDGMVHGGHAVHRQVVEVAQPDRLQRAQRVALLGEEDVVRLQALERDHPQRVVGEEVHEPRADRARTRSTKSGVIGPPLMTSTTSGRQSRQARSRRRRMQLLVGGLGRRVLVERVVAPVGEEPDLVAEPATARRRSRRPSVPAARTAGRSASARGVAYHER